LISKVGPSFKWLEPRKGETSEYYWWDVGEYNKDTSVLDHIVRVLINSIPTGDEYPSIEERLKSLVSYFRDRVGYKLDYFEMQELFPCQPGQDYNYALKKSVDYIVSQIDI
ncbi:MAG TPA: hypothetical protein VL461_09665, partial [Dictyobacter sp.]|nr:hypothetical protein [Dictyobacter sp.]